MEKFRLSEDIDPNKVFIVNRSELEGRIDPFFYKSEYSELEKKIEKSKYKKKLLKELIYKVINGLDFRDYDIKGGIPYIKVANIKKGFFDFSNLQYITPDIIKLSKDIRLKKGNLLLTRKGTFGNALCLEDDYNYIISSEVFYLKVKQSIVLSKYLEIYFNSNIGQKFFKKISIGAIMGSLSQDSIKSIKIPLPPLEIQQQIVGLYEKAYAEKQQKEAEAQRLLDSIDDYLLGELGITLPKEDEHLQQNTDKNSSYNLDNDNPLVKKGRLFLTNLSEVTGKRWSAFEFKNRNLKLEDGDYLNKTLKHLAHLLKGQSITSNEIEKGNYPVIAGGQISPYTHNQYNFKGNVITISASGAYSGYVWYHNYPIFASDCTVVFSKEESEITTLYLSEILKLKQKEIYNLQQGAGQPHVYARDLERINIPIPPLQKQNEIATHISQIRNKANALKQEGKEILEQAKQEVEQMILGN